MNHLVTILISVLVVGLSSNLRAATFELLFPYGGYDSEKSVHVSDDGSIVLGSNSIETYVWEESKGLTAHGGSARRVMSGDGRTILTSSNPSKLHLFDASFDGSVVAGSQNRGSSYLTFEAAGIVSGKLINLGKLEPDDTGSRASAVSADGSTIVGASYANTTLGVHNQLYRMVPFRWTAETGMVALDTLSGAETSYANDVSGDGSVIVGRALFNHYTQLAFRWTEATGVQSLDDLPGGLVSSEAFAVSTNGKVIVGSSYAEPHLGGYVYDLYSDAFIWTDDDGMKELRSVLIDNYKLNLGDFRLRSATGVSANGNVVVGWGVGSAGAFAWRANLVPEPTALAYVAIFAMYGSLLRKRR
jgi:uncharacterized membrane protein